MSLEETITAIISYLAGYITRKVQKHLQKKAG